MEAVPTGRAMPKWLVNALLDGRRLMVIHPTEESRRQAIELLHNRKGGGVIDTTHHLTLIRLIRIIHLDLRLPGLLEDDGVLFELCHNALVTAASDYGFPLLQSNPSHQWSRSRSRRLLTLHREIIGLLRPQDWEEDPGAIACDQVLQQVENELSGTHPARLERKVWQELKNQKTPPFTLADVEGIIMLNHASGLSEVEIAILSEISRLKAIHQLINPGSHRLGFHGEYIDDVAPSRSIDALPPWVPVHEVWAPSGTSWSSPIGESRGRTIHHMMVELASHIPLALADLLPRIEGDVLLVHGTPDVLRTKLQPHLYTMGVQLAESAKKVSETPGVTRILSIADISRGEEAWSLTRLRDLDNQISLPLSWPMFEIAHPSQESWTPRLYPAILEEIARSFHLLGGEGSLRRWLSILGEATPRAGVNPERRSQQLEECQWWLACLAKWMSPILSERDLSVISEPVIGCSTGQILPLPDSPENPIDWFNSLLNQIDWENLASRNRIASSTVPGIQYLIQAFNKFNFLQQNISDGEQLLQVLTSLAENTQIPAVRGSDNEIKILSPEQALGVEADVLIMCGIDAESWSMKPASIPWLDEASRMRLGIHRPDTPLRRGRHHLYNLLNCSQQVVILDPSMEEGKELAGPLDEWFSRATRLGEISEIENPPNFLNPSTWNVATQNRSWEWRNITSGILRLVHRVTAMELEEEGIRTHRSGNLPRDDKQRAGLATIEGRQPLMPPLNISAIIPAAETVLLRDQISRKATGEELAVGEIFGFNESSNLIQSTGLKIIPTSSGRAEARLASVWPHLGVMGEKGLSLGIDPRPIFPPSTRLEGLDLITGRAITELNLPKIWSPSRLQAWLECPRAAWYSRHLYIGRSEILDEDIAASTRGNIVHIIEEAILMAHGVPENAVAENPLPLHLGLLSEPEDAWNVVLNTLVLRAPWMRRADGISAHRSRDLIGVSPEMWIEWLENETPIPLGGRLGRMLLSDYSLCDVAPIASEWEVSVNGRGNVSIELPTAPESEDEPSGTFLLRGRVDRVDELLLDPNLLVPSANEIIPLDFDSEKPPAAKRFVIIRDIKSIDGTRDDGKDGRHLKGIFAELQLALYARAWEIANPGDRVVGIGATQVGNSTQAHVEIDPEFVDQIENLEIGIVSRKTHLHFRRPGEPREANSNPFRAWMRERIATALRVIRSAEAGNIHPEPSSRCQYCTIADSCPSVERGENF